MVRSAGPRDVLDALPRTAKRVRSVIEDVVACEGPIHHERLAKLVGSAFGLSRVTSSRAASVLALLPSSMAGDRGEPFAWPPELDHRSWKGFRRAAEGTARPIEYIPLREMANAMVALAGTAYGIREDELLRETLLLFGGKALTQGTRSRLDEGLRSAIAAGRLAEREGLIVVAER
ncbi:MAG: DUF3320 domain-containing protein [Kineosporiaceae bacterium]